MKINLKHLFLFIILSIIIQIKPKNLTALSECTKGRIIHYTGWENNSECGFEPHKNATGASYLYPVAPNFAFFKSSAKCGICYEMVGPLGAIRVRVEDYCPESDELGFCSGDMYHFNVANNGSKYLIGDGETSNITFRMVECGFSGNIRILTDKNTDKHFLSFVVLDHNLGVSSVKIKETGIDNLAELSRDKDQFNYWSYSPNDEIFYPINIRIYSINGDYVTVDINEPKKEEIYEANSNFKVPNDTYFNISTLEKEEILINSTKCCELDKSDFIIIYKNGKVNDRYYANSEQKISVNYNSNDYYEGQSTINATFQSMGKLAFESIYPIRADQFSGVSMAIKIPNNCSNCLYFNLYNSNKKKIINFEELDTWKVFNIYFEDLEINNNEFNGIVLQYYKSSSQPFVINIGNIELMKKRRAPDAGICVDIPFNENSDIPAPVVPIDIDNTDISNKTSNETENNTIINSTINTINETNYTYYTDIINYTSSTDNLTDLLSEKINGSNISNIGFINILNINIMPVPTIIEIECDSFTKIPEETIYLLFTSVNNGSNSFQTDYCILPDKEPISSFTCQLPNNIPDGIYDIKSPPSNEYSIQYSKNVLVKDGNISFNYIYNDDGKATTIIEETSFMTEERITSTIVITNSIEKIIKSGEEISFNIVSIEPSSYKLENKEIIFKNKNKNNVLYLKDCQENKTNNNMITAITCKFSNNIMEGNYTILADNQNIEILEGQHINLISTNSVGGMITETISKTINSNITNYYNNIYLDFNILYYNSSVKTGNLFPHTVYLVEKEKYLRNLVEGSRIPFPNCTAGDASTEDEQAIGYIRCLVPDYVPAGSYNLQSDGFDITPNSQVNIVFQDDYNKTTRVSINGNNTDYDDDDKYYGYNYTASSSSSSSSKTWIIWLIAGILIFLVIIVVIIACICNKGEDEEGDTGYGNTKENIGEKTNES